MNIKEGQESLKRALLMMNYKLDKTLNENINEATKMIRFLTPDVVLKMPEELTNQLTGLPKANQDKIETIIKVINDAVSGVGTNKEALSRAIKNDNTFNSLQRSLAISSAYKKNYGESLGDALDNELTTYGLKDELNKKIQTQIDQYCAGVGQKNKKWCEMKPEGEIKYGF